MGDLLISIVVEEALQRVEWQVISAVIVDSLQSGKRKEGKSTTVAHTTDKESQAGSDAVHQETLEWMVVQCAKRVGHIESVMARVEVLVEIWHVVEKTVEKVLPRIEEGHGHEEAYRRLKIKVGNICHSLNVLL